MGKVHLEGSGCFREETGRFCGYSSKENRQPAGSFWAGQAHLQDYGIFQRNAKWFYWTHLEPGSSLSAPAKRGCPSLGVTMCCAWLSGSDCCPGALGLPALLWHTRRAQIPKLK